VKDIVKKEARNRMNKQNMRRRQASVGTAEAFEREIEKTCTLCGAKFKCKYTDDDEMSRKFAEVWEVCPECWKKVVLGLK